MAKSEPPPGAPKDAGDALMEIGDDEAVAYTHAALPAFDADAFEEKLASDSVAIEVPKPGFPWAPVIVVFLYVGAASAFLAVTHFTSDEYKTMRLIEKADALVGTDKGRDKSEEELLDAAQLYLDALLMNPDLRHAHDQIASIKWRFQERQLKFPTHLARKHDMVAAKSRAGQKGTGLFDQMAITAEERYQLEYHRERLASRARWLVGGLGVVVLWAAMRTVQRRREYEKRREEARRSAEQKPTTAEY